MNILQVIHSCIQEPIYLSQYIVEDSIPKLNQTITNQKTNKTFVKEQSRSNNILEILCTKIWIALTKFIRKQLLKGNQMQIPYLGTIYPLHGTTFYSFTLNHDTAKKYELKLLEDPYNITECIGKTSVKLSMKALAIVCNTDADTATVALKEILKKIVYYLQAYAC